MKSKSLSWVLGGALLAAPAATRAAEYYVAPTGSDSAAGTMAAPFATVTRGQQAASAGDTVWIRGGVYTFSGTSATIGVDFRKSGATNNPIKYFAYPGETPIFDLFNLLPQARVTGLNVQCNWIHLKGLAVRGTQQIITGDSWGVRIQGSNNVLEQLNVHHGEAPGIFITSGANNLILNCDSHENYDPLEGGGNGDGFGCHSTGSGNVIRGARAWSNSDDGYDFINAPGTCTVESSWAWSNGYQPGTMTAAGNGAGFKAGGYGSPPETPASGAAVHNVRNCLAFRNRAQGFYANHHPGRINFFNNTAINNGSNFNMLADSGYPSDHVIRNNLATGSGGTISSFTTGGTATSNSWQVSGITVNASDFVNQMEAEAVQPRQADGSLPNIGFMHLVAGSDLIDKGVDVGLPFSGSAPDLGAFEFGAATTGSGGAGGATGVGGATGAGGRGGAGGQGGQGGQGGNAGAGGGAGTGATAGRGGPGGTSGAAGAGGRGGSGAGGSGGGAGVAGTAGTSGSAGSVGSTGSAGTSGAAGTTGSAGNAGSAGTSGAAGASGGAGTSGSAGTTGAAGSGVSGAGGSDDPGDAGCSCSTTDHRASAPGKLGAFLLALLAVARGRRRLRAYGASQK